MLMKQQQHSKFLKHLKFLLLKQRQNQKRRNSFSPLTIIEFRAASKYEAALFIYMISGIITLALTKTIVRFVYL